MKFRKKPVTVEAVQWFKLGDHPEVVAYVGNSGTCGHCKRDLAEHGRILTLEGTHLVCPGDWVICGVANEYYACKDGIFRETYEPAE